MIISASRRTDIPAFYSEWFLNRIKAGFVYVRNPMNAHQISKISLSPDVVDGIVLWTKNPVPIIDRIHELDEYTYYIQFTLNSYSTDVERNVPSKNDVIIPAFQKLSSMIGRERVVWRYDPILINDKYTIDYHKQYFSILCSILSEYTEKCTVSFVDMYTMTARNTKPLGIRVPTDAEILELMESFIAAAKKNGIYIDTCAEECDLSSLSIPHACCIDKQRLERLGNYSLTIGKDKNQRGVCGCVESIDIGAYNTCENGCAYCYANYNPQIAARNHASHDPDSPLLFGTVGNDDVITERKVKSYADRRLTLFDE